MVKNCLAGGAILLCWGLVTTLAKGSNDPSLNSDDTAVNAPVLVDAEADQTYSIESFTIPVLAYLPETSVVFGAAAIVSIENLGVNDPLQSSANVQAVYTLRNQWGLFIDGAFYLSDDRVLLGANLDLRRWVDFYYGIGDSPREDGDAYDFDALELELTLFHRVFWERLYAGLLFRSGVVSVTDSDNDELRTLRGGDGSDMFGVGVGFVVDGRDRALWTQDGLFLQGSYVRFSDRLGSDFSTDEWSLDGRGFTALGSGFVLGAQARLEVRHGDVPFFRQAVIGGASRLRGTFAGRFRDDAGVWAQSELRTPTFWWRIAAVGFAGIGSVGSSVPDLIESRAVVAGGAGVRLHVTDEGANIRADFALGPDGETAFYLSLGEAF